MSDLTITADKPNAPSESVVKKYIRNHSSPSTCTLVPQQQKEQLVGNETTLLSEDDDVIMVDSGEEDDDIVVNSGDTLCRNQQANSIAVCQPFWSSHSTRQLLHSRNYNQKASVKSDCSSKQFTEARCTNTEPSMRVRCKAAQQPLCSDERKQEVIWLRTTESVECLSGIRQDQQKHSVLRNLQKKHDSSPRTSIADWPLKQKNSGYSEVIEID